MKPALELTRSGEEAVAADVGWIESAQMVDIHRMGALLLLSSIRGASKRAELLLRMGAHPNYRGGKFGDTALTAAAIMGRREIVELLLAYHADVNIQDSDGGTPLLWAVVGQHPELVRLLLEAGADPHIPEKDGCTPLQFAIEHGLIHIEQLLLAAGATA